MTVNSYLTNIANNAIIRDSEKESIKRSITALSGRVSQYFGSEVMSHFEFGSSSRGTMVPRKIDKNSDVDYMIVFKDKSYKPQTYLNKLHRFAKTKYSTSEIQQSNPTIVLSLNHIHFELVPALENHFSLARYKIPDRAKSYNDWIDTDPLVMQTNLTVANKENNFHIKPLIRIMKYWNALNNYPYPSFKLEEEVVKQQNSHPFLFGYSSIEKLEDYFFECVSNLSNSWHLAERKRDKIKLLKYRAKVAYDFKNKGNEDDAVYIFKKILPQIV